MPCKDGLRPPKHLSDRIARAVCTWQAAPGDGGRCALHRARGRGAPPCMPLGCRTRRRREPAGRCCQVPAGTVHNLWQLLRSVQAGARRFNRARAHIPCTRHNSVQSRWCVCVFITAGPIINFSHPDAFVKLMFALVKLMFASGGETVFFQVCFITANVSFTAADGSFSTRTPKFPKISEMRHKPRHFTKRPKINIFTCKITCIGTLSPGLPPTGLRLQRWRW
jgi:hypothetical protein